MLAHATSSTSPTATIMAESGVSKRLRSGELPVAAGVADLALVAPGTGAGALQLQLDQLVVGDPAGQSLFLQTCGIAHAAGGGGEHGGGDGGEDGQCHQHFQHAKTTIYRVMH